MTLIECNGSLNGQRNFRRQHVPAGESAFPRLRQELSSESTIAAIPVDHEMTKMHGIVPSCRRNGVANRLFEMSDRAKLPFS